MTSWEHSPLSGIIQRILLPHKTEVTPYTVVRFKMCSTPHKHRERDGVGKIYIANKLIKNRDNKSILVESNTLLPSHYVFLNSIGCPFNCEKIGTAQIERTSSSDQCHHEPQFYQLLFLECNS